MSITARPITRVVDELSRLPGIGPKTAQRLTYFLLRAPAEQAHALAEALVRMKERTVFCSTCFNITEVDPCAVCQNDERDRRPICVVEEPLDVLAPERTRTFKGLYHV